MDLAESPAGQTTAPPMDKMSIWKSRRREGLVMITDGFDSRTLFYMEAALERACRLLPAGDRGHESRKIIASRILQRAQAGDVTLARLTHAGEAAAKELVSTTPHVA